ncbi:hypothetical protein LXL04_019139 [Taraxacum kok-saghyz]
MTPSLRRRRQSEQPWKSTQSAKTSTKNRNIKSENTQKLTTDPSPSAKTSTKPSMITGSKVLCEEWTCEMTNSGAAKVLCEGEEWSCETGGNRGFAKWGQRKNDDHDFGVSGTLRISADPQSILYEITPSLRKYAH